MDESFADQRQREFLVGFYLVNPVTREWGVELRLAEPRWAQAEVQGAPVGIGYYPNEQERLAEIIYRVRDTSAANALRRCRTHVSRVLSHWSAALGRGFDIGGFRIADLDHDARWQVLPHRPSTQGFSIPRLEDLPESFWPLADLYREARNSASDRYRFLCCCKILCMWAQHAGSFAADAGAAEEEPMRTPHSVTAEMLVLSGMLRYRPELEGVPFDKLVDRLQEWRDRALQAVLGSEVPNQPDGYESACELTAIADLADLTVHQILSEEIARHEAVAARRTGA